MDAIAAWQEIPQRIAAAIANVPPRNLDQPFGPEKFGLTLRQTVHHIAEANVVAASIVIAGLGSPGCTYDWSWMMPFGPWNQRLDYAHKPLEPSLRLLETLNAYVVAQIEPLPDGLTRELFLRDEPNAELRRVTIADILRQEIDHLHEHLG